MPRLLATECLPPTLILMLSAYMMWTGRNPQPYSWAMKEKVRYSQVLTAISVVTLRVTLGAAVFKDAKIRSCWLQKLAVLQIAISCNVQFPLSSSNFFSKATAKVASSVVQVLVSNLHPDGRCRFAWLCK